MGTSAIGLTSEPIVPRIFDGRTISVDTYRLPCDDSLAKNAGAFLPTSDEGLSDVCKKEGIKVRLVRAD